MVFKPYVSYLSLVVAKYCDQKQLKVECLFWLMGSRRRVHIGRSAMAAGSQSRKLREQISAI